MRAALVLVGLLLLVPAAAAETSMRIEPAPPVVPLASAVVARFTLTADCEPVLPGAAPRSVHVWIERKPAWATIVVSPSRIALDCASGTVEKDGAFSITVTPEAPAFAPTVVDVGIAYEGGVASSNQTAKASFPITAAFFSILEASVREAIVTMAPGQEKAIGLDLTNRGNAPTLVSFRLANATEDLTPIVPAPVTLAAGARERVDVLVRAAPASGIVNRAGALSLDYVGAYALDPQMAGDKGNVAFVVRTQQAPAPGPDLALAAGAVVAAALAMRLTRRAA